MSLIGGTDPDYATISPFVLGSILVGEDPNDGVVPLRSAQGKAYGSDSAELPLQSAIPYNYSFNHLHVGKPEQPVSDFMDPDILRTLSDWVVVEADNSTYTLPTLTQPGFIDGNMTVDYNVFHGDIQTLKMELWVFNGFGWHKADESLAIPIAGNDHINFAKYSTLPPIDPADPTTNIMAVTVFLHWEGPDAPVELFGAR